MTRRSVRIVLVLFALLVTAGLGYRAMNDEQALGRARVDGAVLDRSAEQTLEALSDLRASLHAYVAPGQGLGFWAARSTALLSTIHDQLLALEKALAPSGVSLADSLDGLDQLSAAEKRTRLYADRGEFLLAGDVIFIEIRDLLSATGAQVGAARDRLRRDTDRRGAAIRQEQAGLAIGAVTLWAIIALVLVSSGNSTTQERKEWRQELADRLKKPAAPLENSAELRRDPDTAAHVEFSVGRERSGDLHRDPVVAPSGREGGHDMPGLTTAALKNVGEICADLSALADVGALTGALERAAGAIGASGVIVWLASNTGDSLSPVAWYGFDARLVARLGAVPRGSANLTAAAFRENAPRISPGSALTPSALAVSMCGPSGPVGVLSAELRMGQVADEACVALATIFAAQLATLALPVSAPAAARSEAAPRRAAL